MKKHYFILTHEDANWRVITEGLSRSMKFRAIVPPERFAYKSWVDVEAIVTYAKIEASNVLHIITQDNNIIPTQFPGAKFLIYLGKSEIIDESKINVLQKRLRRLYEICYKYQDVKCTTQEQLLSGNYTTHIRNFFDSREYNIPGNLSENSKGVEISDKTRKYLNYLNWCCKNLPILRPLS